jgi:hypothetical protein
MRKSRKTPILIFKNEIVGAITKTLKTINEKKIG